MRIGLLLTAFFMGSLSIRVSAVYTPLLAVVRSYNIARPFDRVRYGVVLVVLVAVPATWGLLLGLDLWTLITRVEKLQEEGYSLSATEYRIKLNGFYSINAGTIFFNDQLPYNLSLIHI